MNAHDKPRQVVMGVFILVVGTLALIGNLGIFDTRFLLSLWPLVFVVFGLLKLSRHREDSKRGMEMRRFGGRFPIFLVRADGHSRLAGLLLIALGLVLTLSTTGILHVHFRDLWPLLLMVGGGLIVWKAWRESHGKGVDMCSTTGTNETSNTADGHLKAFAFMSGNRLRADAKHLSRGEATAIMGAVVLDLRQAALEGEAHIDLFVLWGGIEIRVPNDWMVVSNCAPVLGGVDDKTIPPVATAKRLVLDGYVFMGGVEIKN